MPFIEFIGVAVLVAVGPVLTLVIGLRDRLRARKTDDKVTGFDRAARRAEQRRAAYAR